jgi:LCP family protein required for cell wall assembly
VQVRHATSGTRPPARHRLKVIRHRTLKIVATVTISTLLAAFVAVGERIHQLESNMQVIDIGSLLGQHSKPPQQAPTTEAAPFDPFGGRAVNIMITAIDSRAGGNAYAVGDSMETLLNDVNMIAHISADRQRVDVVAIPRDTLVPLPACQTPNGSVSGQQREAMINEAFGKGAGGDPEAVTEGVACVFKTVEEITQIPLDAFILVDFAGFAAVVDALGGVDVCVPYGLIGRRTTIDLKPGMHHLDGYDALAYARTREGKFYNGEYLDGSDLKRINRQQQLIATVINEVLSSGSLSDLPKLNSTATAVTSALFVSPELGSVGSLAGLAYALRSVEMQNVSLFMVPVSPAGQRVRLSQYGSGSSFGGLGASELFQLLAADQPIPGTTPYKVANDTGQTATGEDPGGGTPGTDATGGGDGTVTPPPPADDDFVTALDVPVTCEVGGQGGSGG